MKPRRNEEHEERERWGEREMGRQVESPRLSIPRSFFPFVFFVLFVVNLLKN